MQSHHWWEDQDAKISHLPSNNSATDTKPIRSLNHPLGFVLLKPPQEVIYAFLRSLSSLTGSSVLHSDGLPP